MICRIVALVGPVEVDDGDGVEMAVGQLEVDDFAELRAAVMEVDADAVGLPAVGS